MKIEYSKKQQNNPPPEINRGNHFKREVRGGVSDLTDGKNEKLTEEDILGLFDTNSLQEQYGARLEVSEDATPDSVFKGNVTDEGELDTHGAGSLHITDIYRIDDHQYAFGKISWPDGISGSIYLVRP